MPPGLKPINRRNLVLRFRRFGFEGPFSGGKHQFMVKGNLTIRIPNPHSGDIGVELLIRILRQADISKEDWEKKS